MLFFKKMLRFIRFLFRREKDDQIYYVNGSDILPPPLTAEEEARVVAELDSASPERLFALRNTLVEHNLRLVVYIAKKFENTGIGTEDLVSIGTIGLMKAINTYKAEKNIKIATYASKCIENEILMHIRKNTPLKLEISIDEPLNVDWDGNELLLGDILGTDSDEIYSRIELHEEKVQIGRAIERLSKRDREIIHMRFGLDCTEEKTQKEVAEILGISQSYISRLEKRILNKLKKEIMKL